MNWRRFFFQALLLDPSWRGGALLLCALLFTNEGRAQTWRIAYYGETVTHYGLKVGTQYPLKTSERLKKTEARVTRNWLFTPGVALYRHPQNHVGLVVAPEITYQRLGPKGGLLEAGIAPSYFRYFLEGQTYRVTPSGELQKKAWAGRSTFLPTLSLGIGKDLSVKKRIPLAWYTRLNWSVQVPYNASFLPRVALEAGIIKKRLGTH
ncbi:hypothetical protein SAMN05421823_104409 [Catalinimonas alkaloidigena]|uniref:Outer membrane protein beta-barrel domain-containing protein n=1 Tax=Catalinimonas alkaloidigena TaxID=1075417 RepID=A0A1G9HFQ8_9BACT|nr:hypothetical protein [Catalinimonas alkaloidigena]SDL11293.1 hypothetical protein SAMN05421823_104409 [Catalinimonas alkaloidigena]